MNKFQILAAMIIDEVRAAELANLDRTDPEQAEAAVRDRVEAFLRAHLHETPSPDSAPAPTEEPDDYLTVEDPSADLNLGERWKWKPEQN